MKELIVPIVCLVLGLPAFAADAKMGSENSKFLQEYIKHWKTAEDFTVAVAEKMPADSFDFKPNPEEMGFGALMAHIAGAHEYFFSNITGTKVSIGKPANMEKATVIKFLADSFDTVTRLLEQMTDTQLNRTSEIEDQQMSGREGMVAALGHVIHHRGQAEVYLRVKNIKPPDYRF
jgi:uncharacterized damage-inducible protein DinB